MTRKGGLVGKRRDERRKRAVKLRARGMGVLVIAYDLGCSASTVYELLREAKAAAPPSHPISPSHGPKSEGHSR